MNRALFEHLPAAAIVCLALSACAPVPRLRANWYAVIDTEVTLAPSSAASSADPPTEDVYRKLLAILNEDKTPLTISRVFLNPSWTLNTTYEGRHLEMQPDSRTLQPGKMLLIELEKETIPTGQRVRYRRGTSAPWICDIPTRVKLDVKMEQQLWDRQGYERTEKDVLIDIAQPFPTSLPLGWAHGCKLTAGDAEAILPSASAASAPRP